MWFCLKKRKGGGGGIATTKYRLKVRMYAWSYFDLFRSLNLYQ